MEMSKELLDFDFIICQFAPYRLIEFYHNLGKISSEKCAVLHFSESRIYKIIGLAGLYSLCRLGFSSTLRSFMLRIILRLDEPVLEARRTIVEV